MRRSVRLLCTGNAARSEMAEAIVSGQLGKAWEATGAGAEPPGIVHPSAVRDLAEIGFDHHGCSRHVDEFRDVAFDRMVTICGAAAEQCPASSGPGRHLHLGKSDPAQATGSDEDVLATFRSVRLPS